MDVTGYAAREMEWDFIFMREFRYVLTFIII